MILRGHVKEGFKGTVQRDFWPPVYFIIEPIWAPDEQAELFSNSVSISPRYSNLSIEKTDSAQYHTVQSPQIFSPPKIVQKYKLQYDSAQSLTQRSMILRGVNFEKLEHL